jgi:branched-chain amino acid transport system substrate-binding protein
MDDAEVAFDLENIGVSGMRIRIWIGRAWFVGVLCLGCGEVQAPVEPIVLATVYNVTGFQAVLDVPSSNGSILAASEINANGGVFGRELSFVPVNGNSVPESLAAGTEALLDQNESIVALLGLSDTDMVLAAAPVAASHHRVFLSSGATSPKLPGQVPDYLFLACFGDNVQAAAGAEWAYNDLGARTVLVLFDPNESYPTLLQGYFATRFTELGGKVAQTRSIDPRSGPITLPSTVGVDLVFLSVQTAEDAARVIPVLRASGYAGPILGGDGYDAEETWADHPEFSDVYFTTHVYLGADSPNPRVTAFLDAYTAAFPGEVPSAFAALGYDAVSLLAAAMVKAGAATPTAVASGLSGLEGYAGVTGTISFRGSDRIPTKSVTIIRVAGGKQNFVAEVTPLGVPRP